MNVRITKVLSPEHSLEFGDATYDNVSPVIRNRYDNANGVFSPRASSEVPLEDFVEMCRFAGEEDIFSTPELAVMLKYLSESLSRQNP